MSVDREYPIKESFYIEKKWAGGFVLSRIYAWREGGASALHYIVTLSFRYSAIH